ncbi:MAG: sterol desaturase family protein, partial [Cyanobium sp.]
MRSKVQHLQQHSLGFWGLTFFAIILARYFLLAGLAHWWLYRHRPGQEGEALSKPTERRPTTRSIWNDIRLSVHSAVVFALAAVSGLHLHSLGLTRLYTRPEDFGWWYLGASYLLVLILQDGFFYGCHRLSHHPALFSWMHRGHHRSSQPTPWTSFAFDSPEAVLQAL